MKDRLVELKKSSIFIEFDVSVGESQFIILTNLIKADNECMLELYLRLEEFSSIHFIETRVIRHSNIEEIKREVELLVKGDYLTEFINAVIEDERQLVEMKFTNSDGNEDF